MIILFSNIVKLKLNFETGLDRYYGLLDIAEKYGIFKKVSTRYELPDGSKVQGRDAFITYVRENEEFRKSIEDKLNG